MSAGAKGKSTIVGWMRGLSQLASWTTLSNIEKKSKELRG